MTRAGPAPPAATRPRCPGGRRRAAPPAAVPRPVAGLTRRRRRSALGPGVRRGRSAALAAAGMSRAAPVAEVRRGTAGPLGPLRRLVAAPARPALRPASAGQRGLASGRRALAAGWLRWSCRAGRGSGRRRSPGATCGSARASLAQVRPVPGSRRAAAPAARVPGRCHGGAAAGQRPREPPVAALPPGLAAPCAAPRCRGQRLRPRALSSSRVSRALALSQGLGWAGGDSVGNLLGFTARLPWGARVDSP